MAQAQILPSTSSGVLEDAPVPLPPTGKLGDGEEFVDLTKPEPAPAPAAEPAKLAPAAAAPAAEPAKPAEDEIPEELRGKTPAQLAKMYREAQSAIGRQGSELGDLRRRVDGFIQATLAGQNKPAPTAAAPAAAPAAPAELDEAEFFRKPFDAVQKAIAEHPAIKRIEETLGKTAADQASARAADAKHRFDSAHPDAVDILANPEFQAWVGASRVRQGLLMRAHRHYDFDAGDEVFSTWKALNKKPAAPAAASAAAPAVDPAAAASDAARTLAARRRELQAAGVPTGGNGSAAPASGSKKIFRRADILDLMENNPARYEQLAAEIELAYREKRVR